MSGTVLAEPGTPAFDLRAAALAVARSWRVLLLAQVAALLLAVGVLKLAPASYQSTVQVLIFDPQRPGLDAIGREASSGRDYDAVAMNSEVELIKSTSLAIRVARDLHLSEDPEFQVHGTLAGLKRFAGSLLERAGLGTWPAADDFPAHDASSAALRNDPPLGVDKKTEQAAAIVRAHVSASRVPLTYVLVISATSRSPQMARLLAATLIDEYLADQHEVEQKALDRLSGWLGTKVSDLKGQIADTSMAAERLRLSSGSRGQEKGSLADQQVADLNTQLMSARADMADKAARLEQLHKPRAGTGGPDGGLDGVSSPLLTDLLLRRSNAARLHDQLRTRLGDRHAEVVALEGQLSALDKAIDEEAARAASQLQSDFEISARKAQALASALQRLKTADADPDAKVRLQELERAAETQTKTYDDYLGRLEQVDSLKSLGVAGQRIISPASLPTRPSFPPRNAILLGAMALALLSSTAVVVYFKCIRRSLANMARAESCLGLPVVLRLPLARGESPTRPGRKDGDKGLPPPSLAEAGRSLRMRLRGPGERAEQVVLVTSSRPREGRSAVATLLASSSAAARQKTLLLSCDASPATILIDEDRARPGLMDVLDGSAELPQIVTRLPGFGCDVILAGARSESSGDLLASPRMTTLMAELKSKYDFVVIDGPAATADGEVLALAELADRILIVIDPARSDLRSVTGTLRLLQGHAGRIAGLAFNDSGAAPARPVPAGAVRRQFWLQGLQPAMAKAMPSEIAVGRRRET